MNATGTVAKKGLPFQIPAPSTKQTQTKWSHPAQEVGHKQRLILSEGV